MGTLKVRCRVALFPDSWCSCLQAAQVVLIALFELNTPEFTMLLGALPKTFQDGATKLLHSHLKNTSNTGSNVVSYYYTPSSNCPAPGCGSQSSWAPFRFVKMLQF